MIQIETLAIRSRFILLLVFFLVLLIISFGLLPRWDLLQQISMADQFNASGNFYPNPFLELIPDASVYFPGVAIMASIFKLIIPEIIFLEFMLVIACCSVILLFITQYLHWKDILFVRFNIYLFVASAIIFSLLVASRWLSYAVEFKPDTIAVAFGSLFIYFAYHKKEKFNFGIVSILGFCCGLTLIFKQQYLAFLLGIFVHTIFFPSAVGVLFSVFTFLGGLTIASYIYMREFAWYWTYQVLVDDGLLSVIEVIKLNWETGVMILLILLFTTFTFNLLTVGNEYFKKEKNSFFNHLRTNPYLFSIGLFAVSALVSALKVGGNHGNTQLALIILWPYLFIIFFHIRPWFVYSLAWVAILFTVPQLYKSAISYSDAKALERYVVSGTIPSGLKFSYGSDLYFAARRYQTPHVGHSILSETYISNVSESQSYVNYLESKDDMLVFVNRDPNIVILEKEFGFVPMISNSVGSIGIIKK